MGSPLVVVREAPWVEDLDNGGDGHWHHHDEVCEPIPMHADKELSSEVSVFGCRSR